MGDTQQSLPAGPALTGAEAAAVLAEVQVRQDRVVKTVLVPLWYWWAMAAGTVAIGTVRDSNDLVLQAITIPLAALVMAGLTGAMIPALRRRVQVHGDTRPGTRGVAAIVGLIVLVDAVVMGVSAGLEAGGFSRPATVGAAGGAMAIVIGGPLVNRYLKSLMLSRIAQHGNDAVPTGGSTS